MMWFSQIPNNRNHFLRKWKADSTRFNHTAPHISRGKIRLQLEDRLVSDKIETVSSASKSFPMHHLTEPRQKEGTRPRSAHAEPAALRSDRSIGDSWFLVGRLVYFRQRIARWPTLTQNSRPSSQGLCVQLYSDKISEHLCWVKGARPGIVVSIQAGL